MEGLKMTIEETINKKLDELGEKISTTYEVGSETLRSAAEDLAGKASSWKGYIDEICGHEIFQKMYGAVREGAVSGKDAAIGKLEEVKNKYDETLNEMLEEKPRLVGGIDGFYQAITAKEPERSKGPAYTEGKGIGKAIGWTTTVIGLYGGGLVVKAAASTPLIIRAFPGVKTYISEKISQAKEKVGAEKEGPSSEEEEPKE